jgi:hypothetical protein
LGLFAKQRKSTLVAGYSAAVIIYISLRAIKAWRCTVCTLLIHTLKLVIRLYILARNYSVESNIKINWKNNKFV